MGSLGWAPIQRDWRPHKRSGHRLHRGTTTRGHREGTLSTHPGERPLGEPPAHTWISGSSLQAGDSERLRFKPPGLWYCHELSPSHPPGGATWCRPAQTGTHDILPTATMSEGLHGAGPGGPAQCSRILRWKWKGGLHTAPGAA